jgi:hypothetical protein
MRTIAPLIALLLVPLAVPHAAESSAQPGGSDLPARLAGYLEQHRVRAEKPADGLEKFAEAMAAVERRPDPFTSFETFIFGIKRRSARLLAPEQSKRWEEMLARHTPITRRWHDERNLVRCLFERVRWDYAVSDDGRAAETKREMARWLDLRMAWMFEEEIAHDRFCRDAWKILTDEQRRKILAGEWDGQVKKSTGHSYESWADRIVTRALGKPQDKAAFDRAAAAQKAAYAAPHGRYTAAATRHRRASFAMDVNSEETVIASWREVDRTFREIVLAEAEAIRVLCRAGYALSSADLAAKAGEAKAAIWRQALERFQAAQELIKLITR